MIDDRKLEELNIEEIYDNLDLMYKANFPNNKVYSIDLISVRNMPIHYTKHIELIYVLSGSFDMKVSFNNYRLDAGDFILVNPYELRALSPLAENNLILHMRLDKNGFKNKLFAFAYDYYNLLNQDIVSDVKEKMTELYFADKFGGNGGTQIKDEIIRIIDTKFLMEDFNVTEKEMTADKTNKVNLDRVKNAYEALYFKYGGKLRLKDIADSEHIDTTYASRLFKELMGLSFQHSINNVRIDRAEIFLLGTDIPIQEISDDLGFSSYDYFSKNFKSIFGKSAGAYRKECKPNTFPAAPMDIESVDLNKSELRSIISDLRSTKKQDSDVLHKDIMIKLLENVMSIATELAGTDTDDIYYRDDDRQKQLTLSKDGKVYVLDVAEQDLTKK